MKDYYSLIKPKVVNELLCKNSQNKVINKAYGNRISIVKNYYRS
jgi:hypothetical protein